MIQYPNKPKPELTRTRLNPNFLKPDMSEPNISKFEHTRTRLNPTFSITGPSLNKIQLRPNEKTKTICWIIRKIH